MALTRLAYFVAMAGCLAAAINREEFDSPNHTAHIETKVVMIALLPSFNRASKERGFIGYIGSKV